MKPYFVIPFVLIGEISQAGSSFINSHFGTWYGVGVQTNGSNWDMLVTLGYARGQVSYNSLNCGGWWTYQSENAVSLIAVESLTYGQDVCIETGDVRLEAYGDGHMLYMWCGAEDGVSAMAILSRTPPSPPDYATALLATKTAQQTMGQSLDSISCTHRGWFGV